MKRTIATFVLALSALVATATELPTLEKVDNSEITTNTVLNSELNPFCKAIVLGKTDMVKQMIELGENINQKCLGKTPAMYAARYNKAEILSLLITNGADLTIQSDKEHYTAEKFAKLSSATETLAIITAAKQDVL
ncbi:hypothetical protein NBRC110019_17440 [Neptunitalea chrysea]|uniref:Ankyrin repeat-containing protein n=1 Tax=Neptunitalea chrysea TaxID=1647581 RepID=A0A9W6B534_9FLAO|nr:ankyrin repeat domain-containing protein [Neptunitalea chrysea]GLB52704.1 hypothetical protein NBRC110019_17440 [Neptunitalea chrysea]